MIAAANCFEMQSVACSGASGGSDFDVSPSTKCLAANGKDESSSSAPFDVAEKSALAATSKEKVGYFKEFSDRLANFVRTFEFCGGAGLFVRRAAAKGGQATMRVISPNFTSADHKPRDPRQLHYAGNQIKTTKYTMLTFLPKNLFEQLKRFANIYFIAIIAINWVPQINAFGREIAMIPVIFVLSVTAIKDLFEDRRRYNSDKQVNESTCRIFSYSEMRYVTTKWKDVKVGDLIHLSCNEVIPADILLLRSAHPQGICYIETSNIDGENNLKQRQVVSSFTDQGNAFFPAKFVHRVECEQPNNQIYKFHGHLVPDYFGTRQLLTKEHLLLRGCSVRNTDFVEGLVVYAGHETKAMLNNSGPRYKRSKLETRMNWDIGWCIAILLTLCIAGTIGNYIWLSSFEHKIYGVWALVLGYMTTSPNVVVEAIIVFWNYVITLQVIIPLALYVTIEIVKLVQVNFITADRRLYDEASDQSVQCRALNIPEDLGQVQFIMSDKTGTLTENKMVFRKCAIAGIDYGARASKHRNNTNVKDEFSLYTSSCISMLPSRGVTAAGGSEDAENVVGNPYLQKLLTEVAEAYRIGQCDSPMKAGIMEFFVNMAVCNTVVVNAQPHSDRMTATGTVLGSVSACATTADWHCWSLPSRPETSLTTLTHSGFGGYGSDLAATPPVYGSTPIGSGWLPADETGVAGPLLFFDQSQLTLAFEQPIISEMDTTAAPSIVEDTTTLSCVSVSGATLIAVEEPEVSARTIEDCYSSGRVTPTTIQPSNNAIIIEASSAILKTAGFATNEQLLLGNEEVQVRDVTTATTITVDQDQSEPKSPAGNLSFAQRFFDSTSSLARRLLPSLGGSGRGRLSALSAAAPLRFYDAESPDELALVYAAAAHGVRLTHRHTNYVALELPDGKQQKYQVLCVLPFDSVRKRMSVIIRHPASSQIVLYCKGADNVIFDLLSSTYLSDKQGKLDLMESQRHAMTYATEGLRTLCLAKKHFTEEEYHHWYKKHAEAESATVDRVERLFESAAAAEKGLELLGVTGIEDRLQDGVTECIRSLREANIKLWILTGDKLETAVNIAYACQLFCKRMKIIQLTVDTYEDSVSLLSETIVELDNLLYPKDGSAPIEDAFGLVLDGRTLCYCLQPELEQRFLYVASRSRTVLCCRTTPLQKAAVAKLVKERLKVSVLGIGDGANDVSLLQTADVGVGISGQEGMQAVMASDFAMPKFRFLVPLLLVHGHWCYDRLSKMVLYFFFNNAMFIFTLFWMQIFNGWSDQVAIDELYLMNYNTIFTALPPIVVGIFDQDAKAPILSSNPQLYEQGSKCQLYRAHSFFLNVLDAVWESASIYFIAYLAYYGSGVGSNEFGTLLMTGLVLCSQAHLAIEVKNWTWPVIGSVLLTLVVYFAFALVYNALSVQCCGADPPYFVAETLFSTSLFWFTVAFMVFVGILPRLAIRSLCNSVRPSAVLRVRLAVRNANSAKKREADRC